MHDLSELEMREQKKISIMGPCQGHSARKGKAELRTQFSDLWAKVNSHHPVRPARLLANGLISVFGGLE